MIKLQLEYCDIKQMTFAFMITTLLKQHLTNTSNRENGQYT